MNKHFSILGIGSAIVDILSYKDSSFLEENNLIKGSMSLVDYENSNELYSKLGSATECSGGSCANTIAGFGLLGGNAAFIGKTKNDYFGKIFKKEIEKANVNFLSETTSAGISSHKCVIFVTEDELPSGKIKVERTMATYLDPSIFISEDDVSEEEISQSEIIFFEGYLFDSDESSKAVDKAIKLAKKNGVKVAFTLSDAFCIQRHKEKFLELVEENVDFVFGNEAEFKELYDEKDMRKLLPILINKKSTNCVTRGENGSYVITDEKVYDIEPAKVTDVYDVTGAGDLYAAGFLYGITKGYGINKCGKLAGLCAAEVIKYIGARPATNLQIMLEKL